MGELSESQATDLDLKDPLLSSVFPLDGSSISVSYACENKIEKKRKKK